MSVADEVITRVPHPPGQEQRGDDIVLEAGKPGGRVRILSDAPIEASHPIVTPTGPLTTVKDVLLIVAVALTADAGISPALGRTYRLVFWSLVLSIVIGGFQMGRMKRRRESRIAEVKESLTKEGDDR